MDKNRTLFYVLLIVLLPLAIILLSGNGTLRMSAAYGYHFNDIQASDIVDSSLNNTELAEEIAGYFNSFDDEGFQIYEQNGEFSDPVFDDSEILVMERAKTILKWTLIASIVVFAAAIIVYIYLIIYGEKRKLRISGIIASIVTVAGIIAKVILVGNAGFRAELYSRYIGVILNEESSLRLILESPMEKIYLIFSSAIAMIVLSIFLYINFSLTREKGMFKNN